MQKRMRIPVIVLAVLLTVGLVAGCQPSATTRTQPPVTTQTTVGATSGTTQTNTVATTPASTSTTALAATVIKLMTIEHVHSLMNSNILTFKTLEEKLNIKLDVSVTPGSEYAAKADLMLSTKDYPDIMSQGNNFQLYASSGVFHELTGYMDNKLANYYKYFEQNGGPSAIRNMKDDNGRMWSVAKYEGAPFSDIFYINQTWLDDLGLKVPHTIDELTTVLKEFKKAYPNKIAWAKGPWYGALNLLYGVFGTSTTWYQPEEGKYIYGPVDTAENFKAYMTWANEMWDAGILDRDYLTRDNDSAAALIQNNESGFMANYGDNAALWGKGGTEGSNFTSLGMISKDGVKRIIAPNNPVSQRFYLPTGGKAPLDKILEMINYLYSDEGVMLFAYGVLGDTYTMVNGKPQFTEKITKHELGAVNGRRQFGINPNPFPHVSQTEAWLALGKPADVAAREEYVKFYTPFAPALFASDTESTKVATIATDITKFVSESINKFVVGELNLDADWDKMQAQIQSIGFQTWKDVVMAQYVRWQAR